MPRGAKAAREQLGFGFDEMAEAERVAYLPSTMDDAIPFFRELLARHHAAMLAGDKNAVTAIRAEADGLAEKLNGGTNFGMKAGDDSPCNVLERETAAPPGEVPLWGQTGDYVIEAEGMKIRIEQDGIYGLGASWDFWLDFGAHIVEEDKPFLSETGYRSFLGYHGPVRPGVTPDQLAREVCLAEITEQRAKKPARRKKGAA